MVKFLSEVTKDQLIKFQNNSPKPQLVIIKFEAVGVDHVNKLKTYVIV